jgi:hypothetical protein
LIERKYPRVVVIKEHCWLSLAGCWVAYMLPRANGWHESVQLTFHHPDQNAAINDGLANLRMRKVLEGLG